MPNLAYKIYRSVMFSFSAIPLFVGSLATGYGTYLGYQEYKHSRSLVIAKGTVIDNELQTHSKSVRKSGERAMSVYHPVIKFKAEDGSIVQFTDPVGTRPPDYEVGESVEVLYDAKNKEEASIKSWKRQWLFPTVIVAFGNLAIIAGIGGSVSYFLSEK